MVSEGSANLTFRTHVQTDPCSPALLFLFDQFLIWYIRSEGSCSPNPCKNGGTCSTNFWGNVRCACPADYTGNRCQQSKLASMIVAILRASATFIHHQYIMSTLKCRAMRYSKPVLRIWLRSPAQYDAVPEMYANRFQHDLAPCRNVDLKPDHTGMLVSHFPTILRFQSVQTDIRADKFPYVERGSCPKACLDFHLCADPTSVGKLSKINDTGLRPNTKKLPIPCKESIRATV